jgi:hypothetical protein
VVIASGYGAEIEGLVVEEISEAFGALLGVTGGPAVGGGLVGPGGAVLLVDETAVG